MKKLLAVLLTFVLVLGLTGCGSKGIHIAVPNDTTNEARALIILEELGIIKLKDGAGITATKNDIVDNPYDVIIDEIEAAQIPRQRQDVDFAVINSNYAIEAGISPVDEALALEGSYSAYANILAVKQGRESEPLIKALVAALESKEVKEYITKTYSGAVVSTIDNPTDGYDTSIDYATLKGSSIKVAASPTPHAEILTIAKEILAKKDIELVVEEFTDFVVPNNVVEDGSFDANYFQHVPYLEDFNANNGTHLVSVCAIHVEPMGIYGGKQNSLDIFK